MKGFLNKRKASYGTSEEPRPSVDSTNAPPVPNIPNLPSSQMNGKKSWRKKKTQPEEKPELDLSLALPSSENFRTSLIMPNLSARFSMLKEQNDPSSILGKASDDSVLTSNRRSRYADLMAPSPLSDIAEVSSIRDPRRIFARQGSLNEGYITDDDSNAGSIMSRARPGEGNVLFGGRQKIYKIPIGDAGAVRSLGANEARGMRGRALYEDDVITSDFQKMREKERQLERERKLAELEKDADGESQLKDEIRSPSLSLYDEKRDTTSSTNSGPSVLSGSTAATSVVNSAPSSSPGIAPYGAQPSAPHRLERTNSRRLYEQGLDQHMSEAQAAALARMTSIQRKNSQNGRISPHPLYQSRSATNLHDRFDRTSPASSGATSPVPPPSEKLTTFESIREGRLAASQPNSASASSPPWSSNGHEEGALAYTLREQDRGKATAMGAFKRPKKFDEQQYLARQRSLHQQQRSPRLDASSGPNVRDAPPNGRPRMSPMKPRQRPSPEAHYGSYRRQDGRPSEDGGPHAPSIRTDRSWSASSNARSFSNDQRSTSRPSTAGQRETEAPSPSPLAGSPDTFQPQRPSEDASQMSDDADFDVPPSAKISFERGTTQDLPPPLRSPSAPNIQDHPAMRSEQPPTPTREKRHAWSPSRGNTPIIPPESFFTPTIAVQEQEEEAESGANEEDARSHEKPEPILAGLVREHLRQPSNVSSIYPSSPNRLTMHEGGDDLDSPMPAAYAQPGNPWDEGILQGDVGLADGMPEASVITDPMLLSPQPPPSPKPIESASDAAEWMRELTLKHQRDVSTETQHEREAFADEIAQRQRAIQENLKVKAETSRRGPSPGLNRGPSENGRKPFGKLRHRSSRESMVQQDVPSKTMRILGISGNGGGPGPAISDRSPMDDARKPSMEAMQSPPMGRTLHMRMPRASEDSPQQSPGQSPRPSREPSRQRQNSMASERHAPPHRSPPDSSRTSTSQDRPSHDMHNERPHLYGRRPGPAGMYSSRTMYEPSQDLRSPSEGTLGRGEFSGADTMARPSIDSQRLRSGSNASTRWNQPMAPPPNRPRPGPPAIRTKTAPERAPGLTIPEPDAAIPNVVPSSPHSGASSLPQSPLTAPAAPFALGTNMAGQTNTSLSQVASYSGTPPSPASMSAQNPLEAPKSLPPSSFTFPARPAAQRPSSRRTNRSPTIAKGDISDPVLISATSSLDTVALPGGASLRNAGDVDMALDAITRSRQNSLAAHDRSGAQSPAIPPGPLSAPLPASTNDAASDTLSDMPNPPASAAIRRPSNFLRTFRSRNASPAAPPSGLASGQSSNQSSRPQSPMYGNAFAAAAAASRGNSPSPAPGAAGFFAGRKASAAATPTEEEDEYISRPSGGRFRMRKVSSAAPGQKHEAVWAGLVEGRDGPEGNGRGRGNVD
ncbi:MAG: hypothetical protein M1828_005774 [Chrysothrix sp. TS-e1954]|nr:MAG: hypothetical protein M1828_005774 [Chrysothrix sp. TS-e1954]